MASFLAMIATFRRRGSADNGPTDSLFFTAGPDDAQNRVFGTRRVQTP